MDDKTDILQEIPNDDLPKLRDLYEKQQSHATHVYSFFNTVMKWMKMEPETKFFTFYAPNGDWKSDGTFIVLFQFACYDLFVFTLEESCNRLYTALRDTKKFDFVENMVLFYATHRKHREAAVKALKNRGVPVHYQSTTDIRWMPKEKAKDFIIDCPPDFYITTLKVYHAGFINDHWVHNYENSVEYITTFIRMNGGHGLCRKSDNKLVAWVLKNPMGTLGILCTLDEFQRRGFGSLITKSLSKEIALEGHNPLGTVLQDNAASQTMFDKLGFETLDSCTFIGAGSSVLRCN